MPIVDLTSTSHDQPLRRVAIFGDTGSGKTVALATLLKLGTLAVFDYDEQAGKLYEFASAWGLDTAKLTVHSINPAEARSYKNTRALVREYRQGKRVCDFVAVDSITAAYDMCLIEGRELSGETDPGELSWEGGYRSASDHYDILIEDIFGIPCKSVIFNAHMNEEYDKKGEFVKVTPAFPGKKKTHLLRRFRAILTAEVKVRRVNDKTEREYTWASAPSSRRIVRAPGMNFPERMGQDYSLLFGDRR